MTDTTTTDLATIKAHQTATGLRELAAAIESGELPTPYEFRVGVYWQTGPDGRITEPVTPEIARAAMTNCPGDWDKRLSGNHVTYTKSFGPHVSLEISPPRESVCRKVVTGTKFVPGHNEDVVEWVCDSADDDAIESVSIPDSQ